MRQLSVFRRSISTAVICGILVGCQPDAEVVLLPSKMGPQTMRRSQALEYLQSANELLDSKSTAEMAEHFSIRDAKGNRIRLGQPLSTERPWALLDLEQNGVVGTSTERAYRELGLKEPEHPVLVAVIDGGIDIHHEDLAGIIWTNEAEAKGTPGRDNDGNGFVDDVHGWNFIGSRDGKNLMSSSLEVTRELARMRRLAKARALSDSEKTYLDRLELDFEAQSGMGRRTLEKLREQLKELEIAVAVLKEGGLIEESLAALESVPAGDELREQARALARKYFERKITTRSLAQKVEWLHNDLMPHYDLDFDPSRIIGDDPLKLDEVGYGNPDVSADGDHGTHVAGIIGAVRNNGVGIDGQSAFVRIMPIRTVPNGDERDKDVGNAIRYAVDNGAQIINMSFGKSYSPNREYVEEAIRYANHHGVLIVHAAGNEGQDNDRVQTFPSRPMLVENWIEVGASTRHFDTRLAAPFSNYGQRSVDLFAPGMGILSSVPNNGYESYDGTSMAAPEITGIAALILSQYPHLAPKQVREILMRTVRRDAPEPVESPGTGILIDFARLSVSGGVVNAYEALKAAVLLHGAPAPAAAIE